MLKQARLSDPCAIYDNEWQKPNGGAVRVLGSWRYVFTCRERSSFQRVQWGTTPKCHQLDIRIYFAGQIGALMTWPWSSPTLVYSLCEMRNLDARGGFNCWTWTMWANNRGAGARALARSFNYKRYVSLTDVWEAASLDEWLYNGGLLQGCVLLLADRAGLLRRPLSSLGDALIWMGALLDACLAGPQVGHTWWIAYVFIGIWLEAIRHDLSPRRDLLWKPWMKSEFLRFLVERHVFEDALRVQSLWEVRKLLSAPSP